MLPNIVWAIFPPVNDVLSGNAVFAPALDVLENVGRIGLFVTLIIIVSTQKVQGKSSAMLPRIALCMLAGYYVLWVCYYAGIAHPVVLMGMAILPSIYFILTTLQLKNYIATAFAVLFSACHIIISGFNFM